ncbi:MAG: hypothetical protein AB8G23_06120 [Myxococcota bacterium]
MEPTSASEIDLFEDKQAEVLLTESGSNLRGIRRALGELAKALGVNR